MYVHITLCLMYMFTVCLYVPSAKNFTSADVAPAATSAVIPQSHHYPARRFLCGRHVDEFVQLWWC